MSPRRTPGRSEAVLSTQVTGSRYFFLELAGVSRAGVAPAYGGFERCNPDYLVQREKFPFFALELVVEGEGSVTLNGRTFALRPGTLFHYDSRSRLEIRTDPERPMAKYFLCLTGARAAARLRSAGISAHDALRLAMFAEVQRVWDDLIHEGRYHPRHGRPHLRGAGGGAAAEDRGSGRTLGGAGADRRGDFPALQGSD
ncbi:MAG: AraC family ligand binding domain-containing protein [Lacunisphaera sp.]